MDLLIVGLLSPQRAAVLQRDVVTVFSRQICKGSNEEGQGEYLVDGTLHHQAAQFTHWWGGKHR